MIRVHSSGILSHDASYRLYVHGPVGLKEVNWLIAKLKLDADILDYAETDDVMPDCAWYCPPSLAA